MFDYDDESSSSDSGSDGEREKKAIDDEHHAGHQISSGLSNDGGVGDGISREVEFYYEWPKWGAPWEVAKHGNHEQLMDLLGVCMCVGNNSMRRSC